LNFGNKIEGKPYGELRLLWGFFVDKERNVFIGICPVFKHFLRKPYIMKV